MNTFEFEASISVIGAKDGNEAIDYLTKMLDDYESMYPYPIAPRIRILLTKPILK